MPGKVQFIAYQLQTAAVGPTDRQIYPGLADQKRDIEARCKVMLDAIEAARCSTQLVLDAKKIFMAPEFFFRGGKDGVYDIENVSYISEYMDQYLKADLYKKWIFVLGTAVAAMPDDGGDTEIFNIALVRRGGVSVVGKSGANARNTFSTGSSDSRLIYKEYVSSVDFLGPYFNKTLTSAWRRNSDTYGKANIRGKLTRLMPTSGAQPYHKIGHKATPNKPGENKITEQSKSGLGGGLDFTMDGIHFILEICMDHIQKRAEDAEVNKDEVDVHLVTSCGATPEYYHGKKNGFLFLVDGQLDDKDMVLAEIYDGTDGKELDVKSTIDLNFTGTWSKHLGNGKNLFQKGKGRVMLFEAKRLP